ncbi:MAG: S9 family peptidase [Phycisphaerales bacterium]
MNLFATTLAVLSMSAPSIVCAPAAAQERTTPTLELITREPDWIAMSPSSPRWLVDGSGILYRARRPGLVGRDFSDDYLIFTSTINATERPIAHRITPENPGPYFTARGDWDADANRQLLSHNGDLFIFDAQRRNTTQLTRTSDRETGAMFMANNAQIAFSRGGDWYIRSLSGPIEVQAADIRYRDEPTDPSEKREKEAEKRDGLQKQQRELFEIIRLEDERAAVREDDRHAWEVAGDPTETPGPFYMGDDRRSRGTWLSPSGAHMLVATAPSKRADDKRDIMPNYINEDGYVSTSSIRTKVGLQTETPIAFHLLDLNNERVIDISLDDLPTIKDDPLAWLKNKDEQASDSIEQAEKEAEAKENAKPRPVSSFGARWSDSGRYAAFMLRSHDNKDRWIVLIDTQEADEEGNPLVTTAHHIHDEAWIGWNFNSFGFVPGSETLWYISEESNFAQFYTYNTATGERAAHTNELSEVRSPTFTRDGSAVYFRSNRKHPGIQEIERLHLATGDLTPITKMEGTVESFALSPDESSIVFTYSNLTMPPELYLVDVTTPDATPKRLTHTVTEEYLSTDFNTPEIVPIPSSHSEQPIYTRVYLPDAEKFLGQRPIVIFVHGAGYTQHANYEWPYYFREHMFHTVLNNEGFIVLAPDFRASEGYGRDWRTAIYRRMGYPELEDFRDCIDWAVANHNGDRARVGLYGGSYGGFMTLMAMFLEPETYKAGAALRSVTDWRHYNHGYTSNILNTPDIDPESYDLSSPINHAEGLQGHLLMLHGLLDDNVVAQDIIRLSQRLIELEKENWELALHPIEPHGYKEPSSWLDQLRRIHKLFNEHLSD